jgi:hypothetical protein
VAELWTKYFPLRLEQNTLLALKFQSDGESSPLSGHGRTTAVRCPSWTVQICRRQYTSPTQLLGLICSCPALTNGGRLLPDSPPQPNPKPRRGADPPNPPALVHAPPPQINPPPNSIQLDAASGGVAEPRRRARVRVSRGLRS